MAKAVKVKATKTVGVVKPSTFTDIAEMMEALEIKAKAKPIPPKDTVGETSTYITLSEFFKVERGIYNIVRRNVENAKNTLLLGETGVGKTELVSHICASLGLPLTILDMGTMTDPIMSLVGTHVISVHEGKTISEFRKSRFSEIIQKPGVVLLDEISRSPAQANNLLFPCMDFRKELPMEYCFEDTTPIKVHPKCCFVATANLGSQYTGTHKLDRALLDRFMVIQINPLDKDRTIEVMAYHYPKIKKSLNSIVDIYLNIAKAHQNYDISFKLSMRHLNDVCGLVNDGFTVYDSYYAICKGIGGEESMKSIEQILKTK